MKIIIGIDGPRDLNLIEEYTGLEGGGKHHDQIKRLREGKKSESKDSKKREKRIMKELEMTQRKFMKPLHVICMHLDKKQEVIHGVLMQLYVLQGFDFDSADIFTKSLLDKSSSKDYDKYDVVVNVLKEYLKDIYTRIDAKENIDGYPDYIKDKQELIILHSKINGGVAHNRNMTIHYIYRNNKDFSEYTHIHFLDYSGQLGRPFFDNGLVQGTGALSQGEDEGYGIMPSSVILSNNGTKIPIANDDMYIGTVYAIENGENTYKQNKVAINSSTGMSLWPKYIPMSDIKEGFSFINADMNEDLFMLQQINRVPLHKKYKPVASLHYYNGLGEHPNPIHIKDLDLAMKKNIENKDSELALEAISKLWTQCYLRVQSSDFENIASEINELIPRLKDEYTTDMRTIIDKLIINSEDTGNTIDVGAPLKILPSTKEEPKHNEHPYIQLNNGYYYIHLTKWVTQGTANAKSSNIIMKLLEENKLMNYSFKDLYISPIPIKNTSPKTKYVFIPLYSYLEYMHPTNSYIIEYTINKSGLTTSDFMSADVFGELMNDETGIRSGWMKKKGEHYGLLERSPVRISTDGTIHINPLFMTDASNDGYIEYLQFICGFNATKYNLGTLENEIMSSSERMSPYSSPTSSERMMSEPDLSDVKGGDKDYGKFNYYTINHNGNDYELCVYKNKSIHYDITRETPYHDFPEAYHAQIFGGKIGLGLTIILLILVLITVLIIIIINDRSNQKHQDDPHLRDDI